MFFGAFVLFGALLVVQFIGLGVLMAFSPPPQTDPMSVLQHSSVLAKNYVLHLMVLSYPVGMGVLYLWRTHVDKYSWRSLGFARERALPNLARGALTALLTLSVLFSLLWLAGAVRFGGWSSDVQTHSAAYALVSLLGMGLAFIAVGFMEETVFRGYGLANLRQWLGWPVALVLQAAVFAVVHLGNGAVSPEAMRAAFAALPNLFLIAIFFGLAYRKTGSLWFPIGFHIAWNWLLGCVFSLRVSGIPTFRLFEVQTTGNSFLSGGLFGAEGSFFLIPLVLAMIYAMWLVPDHPRAVANLDNPEPTDLPREADSPVPAAVPVTTYSGTESDEDTEEDSRENRYRSRFGSAQGFDSDMLSELKQMQQAREEAERERLEAQRNARRTEEMRQEEIRRAQVAAQRATTQEQTETPTVVEETPSPVTATPSIQEQVPVVAQQQEVVTQPITPTPVAPTEPIVTPKAEEVAEPTPAKPVRRSLEARPRPTAPTIPATPPTPTPQQTAPVPSTAPTTNPEETAPTPPKEAPPKKARPRW